MLVQLRNELRNLRQKKGPLLEQEQARKKQLEALECEESLEVSKECYKEMLDTLRKFNRYLVKLEDAFDCELPPLDEFTGDMIDTIERSTGKYWPDEIWDDVYNNPDKSTDDIWKEVQELDDDERPASYYEEME